MIWLLLGVGELCRRQNESCFARSCLVVAGEASLSAIGFDSDANCVEGPPAVGRKSLLNILPFFPYLRASSPILGLTLRFCTLKILHLRKPSLHRKILPPFWLSYDAFFPIRIFSSCLPLRLPVPSWFRFCCERAGCHTLSVYVASLRDFAVARLILATQCPSHAHDARRSFAGRSAFVYYPVLLAL